MDIYVFDNTLTKMKSVISEDECFEATEVREINKAGQLSLSLILAAKDEVNETDLLAIHKKDDEYYLYRVVKKNLMSDRVEVLGLEYGYYSLKYDGYIKDIRPKKEALSDLIPRILSGTAWQKGKIDTKIAPFTGSFYYIKRLDALAEIADKLACEFEFVVTISNNQITSQRVNVLSHLGTHTGKRFEYGINALEVIAESDATSIVTQAIGRGKGEESGDGYGRRIDFSNVEWKKSEGKPVDKPKGQNWVNDPTTNYLMPGRKRALEIVVFEDETDPVKLLDKTYKWLLQNNRPKVQFKAQVTEVEDLTLGDYVNVIRPDLNIRYETRVFKLTRNLLNENFNEVEFGDNIASTPMDKLNSVSNSINGITDTIQRVEEEITIVDATGVRVNYGIKEPSQKKKGDIWYKETPDGETILMRWNGESWEEVVSNKVIEEINTTVDQAMKDSNQAKEDALNAINKADQAVNSADELTNKVVKIDTDIENINKNLRNPNIIPNPEPMFTLVDYPKTQDSIIDGDWQKMDDRVNNKEILTKNNLMFQVSSGKKVTQQVEIEVEGDLQSLTFSFFTNQHNRVPATIKNLGNKRYIAYSTWTSNSNGNIRLMDIINVQFTGSFIKFRHPKLEYGDYTSYYIDSEEINNSIVEVKQTQKGIQETVSNIDGRVTQNTQTLDGFNRKIQGIEGQITEINETSEGLRVDINNNKGNIGKLTASSEVFQTKLQNLEEDTTTKITQLDKLIQLQASQIGPFYPNGNFDDENLTKYYDLTLNDIGASVQIQDKTLVLQSTSAAKASAITKDYIEVDGTQPFIIKFQAQWGRAGSKANARIYVHEYDGNKTEIRNANDLIFSAEHHPDNFWKIEKKWVTDKNPKYIRIEWVVWGDPATELKLKNITLSNGQGNLSASVNVALEEVSLAVKKNGVINAINVSTEGVTIAGEKVHITGRTTIDNAVIKDAMIANLSASKLTAGTIDASKINVININAANIIGNTSEFVKTAWNNINSSLRVDGNGLSIKKSNGENLLLSNGSFQFRDRNNKEIFGISRFTDGNIHLAVNTGEYMSIMYNGSTQDNEYSSSLKFNGTTGSITFDTNKIWFQDKELRFTTMDWGTGRIPSIRDTGNKVGIGLGGSTLHLGDAKGILTLDNIRQGKLDALTFPDGRRLNLVSGTIGSTKVGFIMGVNDVGIAWSGGDLYFHNMYRSGWIKFEDILKKINW